MHTAQITALAAVFFLAACGDEEASFAEPQTRVASLSGGEVLMGARIVDGQLDAYVCGDAQHFQTHSRWFVGALDSDQRFSLATDGWVLEGRFEDQTARVALTAPDGTELEGRFDQILDGELGGVFENTEFGCRVGAVVVPDVIGAVVQGAWCNQEKLYDSQVTPVSPLQGPVERFPAHVLGSDTEPFFMNLVD